MESLLKDITSRILYDIPHTRVLDFGVMISVYVKYPKRILPTLQLRFFGSGFSAGISFWSSALGIIVLLLEK